ncbi:hypothetical protein [Romboutsia ilealis]|uniref:hypothetical protein n=1 Tax=Romboutsia ilealis TaxID=1115758 RepID=UPI00272AE2A2|nr:hypothetical protein [Romboutsia ilealis]
MDYFKNVETRVRRTSTGISDLHNGYLSNSVVNVPVNESTNKPKYGLAKAAEQKEKMVKKVNDTRKKINKQFNNTKLEADTKKAIFNKKSNEMHKKGKNTIFKSLLTEMYIQSLYLDEDFILENFNNIAGIVENFVDDNGGYSLLENAYYQSKSPLLKKMIDICEETSKRVNGRVYETAEKSQNADLLNFELDSDEKEKFDYDKRDLGIEEISNIVKEKVLTVVKDEKAREQKHEELMEDIENELSENPNVTDEKSVKENLSRIFAQSSPTEEGTLFNALLRSNYKSILEGTAPLFTNEFCIEENFLDDIEFEDADIDEEDLDLYDEEEILDEEIFEVFDENAASISQSLTSNDDDSTEELEESLCNMKRKIKDVVKNVKSGKRAKKVKKDVRKIQKSTDELEEACKKNSKSPAKKKVIESFIDDLDDITEDLDNIIDIHESALLEACKSMSKTSESGKSSKKLTLSKNDIHLPNVKFMYKVKEVKKGVGKLVKKSANTSSINKTKQIVKKNISNVNDMIFKLEKSKNKNKKIKALESFRESLNNILPAIEENVNQVMESIDTLGLDEIATEAFRNEMTEVIQFEQEEFIEESANSVDMDQILAQTIANYTLMEMCYTIKLANYKPIDIKNMSSKLLNK